MRLNLSRLPPPPQLASLAITLGLAAAVLYILTRKVPAGSTLAAEVTAGVTSTAANAAGGVVLGLGDAVGLPRTQQTQCQADLAAGRWWDASFSCPAGTFLGSVIGD